MLPLTQAAWKIGMLLEIAHSMHRLGFANIVLEPFPLFGWSLRIQSLPPEQHAIAMAS